MPPEFLIDDAIFRVRTTRADSRIVPLVMASFIVCAFVLFSFGGPRIVVCRKLERTAGAGMELTILSKKGHEVLLLLSCLRHSVTSSAYSDRVS